MAKNKRSKKETPKSRQGVPEERPPAQPERRRYLPALMAFVIFCAAFLVYANTLGGDFIWDDEYLILKNSQVKDLKHLPNTFRTYVGYGSENVNNFYRPLQEISNMIDYRLWGGRPGGFHLTNTVLHSIVSVLVFIFLLRAVRDIVAASAAAVLYAVHPVHSEAVAYIAGRADPLYACFLMGALVLYSLRADKAGRGARNRGLLAASLFLYAFSLLSKELAVTGPVLVFMYPFFFLRGTERDRAYREVRWDWVPFAAMAGVYIVLRATVLNFSDIAPSSVLGRIPAGYRLLTFSKTVLEYLRILAFPGDLHMERVIPVAKSFLDARALVSSAAVVFLVWMSFRAYRAQRAVSFGIAWFFVNLVPVSNIVPINSFIAEHWIYLASVGPFLIIGVAVSRSWHGPRTVKIARPAIAVCVAAAAGAYGAVTVSRNAEWNNEIAFFESTLKYHAKNPRLYLNLGNTYFENNDLENALVNYRKCIEIMPDYAVAYGNIGSVYLRKQDRVKAEEYIKRAVELRYNYPIAHYNLGLIEFQKGSYNEALDSFTTAVEQLPQMYQAWNMLGRVYLLKRDLRQARAAFARSLAILPDQPDIRQTIKKTDSRPKPPGV